MNPFGGEPWALTIGDRAANAFAWVDSHTILFTAQEETSAYEKIKKANQDFSQVVEDDEHEPAVRLFEVDVNSAQVTPLTKNTDRIQSFSVSPDGMRVVTYHDSSLRSSYDQSVKPVILLTDLKLGKSERIFQDAKYHLLSPLNWQKDSRGFYVANASTRNPKYSYPAIFELYHYSLETRRVEKVDLNWDNGLDSGRVQVTDQGFITLLAEGCRTKPARYSLTGGVWRRKWITGLHATNMNSGFSLAKDDKTLLYGYSTPTFPTQYYRATLNKERVEAPIQLTSLNPQFQNKPIARCEIIHWKGALGETVEGLLYYPTEYVAGRKYPLVVEIHGGPASSFQEKWWTHPVNNNNLLNQRGVFIFRPNYHGSSGYGPEWLDSNIGRVGELEVEDINSGVDELVGRGLVDPGRLGIMGWSNGASLTASVTVSTNRYKAAVAGDGLIDLIDYWAKSDIGAWYCGSYFGKTPLDDPATLMRYSPYYQLGKVTTPTLILFGAQDNRVPVEQGWMYYRALQQTGKAPVKFILFPGEGHGPSKLVYIKSALNEEIGWFQKYLSESKN